MKLKNAYQWRSLILAAGIAVVAGASCSADPTDVSASMPQEDDDGIFLANDDQAKKLAADLGIEQVITERPDIVRGAGDLVSQRVFIDERGEAHHRIAQSIDGIPVFGSEVIAHLDRRGKLQSVTDYLVRDIRIDTKPAISKDDALRVAYSAVDGVVLSTRAAELRILPRPERDAALTYKIDLDATTNEGDPSMPVVFVDAKSGEIVFTYDNLKTAKNRSTYTTNYTTSTPGTLKRSEGQTATGDSTLDTAHDNAGIVWNYYSTRHGRDSFSGSGATITSTTYGDTGAGRIIAPPAVNRNRTGPTRWTIQGAMGVVHGGNVPANAVVAGVRAAWAVDVKNDGVGARIRVDARYRDAAACGRPAPPIHVSHLGGLHADGRPGCAD